MGITLLICTDSYSILGVGVVVVVLIIKYNIIYIIRYYKSNMPRIY